MDANQTQNEMKAMIDAEIEKINNGARNESNVMKLAYLNIMSEGIMDALPRIGNSREKDEEVMRWRYAQNEIKWVETLLMHGKTIAVQERIDEIKALEKADPRKFSAQAKELEILTLYRDVIKANYYRNLADYEQIMKERKQLEDMDISVIDLQMSGKDIVSSLKGFSEKIQSLFWEEYFKYAAEHIYTNKQAQKFSERMMGQ